MLRSALLRSVAVLMLVCGVPQAAFASENPPLGGWVVGPMKTAGGGRYCSMKTAYAASQTLVFARDTNGKSTLAVDFGKDMLGAGYRYDVLADAGSTLRKKLPAVAATRQVIVMRPDKKFIKALHDKDDLYLRLMDKDYAFGLSGVSAGLKSLTTCAERIGSKGGKFAQVVVPASKGRPVFARNEVRVERGLEDNGEAEKLRAQVDRLKEENDAAVQAMQAENQRILSELARLRGDNLKLRQMAEEAAPVALTPAPGPEPVAAAPVPAPVQSGSLPVPVLIANQKPTPVVVSEELDPLKDLLNGAKIAGVQETPSSNPKSYSWVTDNVFGFAQDLAWNDGQNLTETAESYIKGVAARCKGDFARTLGAVSKAGKKQVLEAEMACMGRGADSAAAVLFVADGGKLHVILQEGAPEHMPAVLEKRASIESFVMATVN